MKATVPLLLSLAQAGSVVAQERILIPERVTCAECRIVLEHVATLGKLEDDVAISPLSTIATDSEGRFYVGGTYNQGELAMYDADGTLLRSFGRLGQGPGEFGR